MTATIVTTVNAASGKRMNGSVCFQDVVGNSLNVVRNGQMADDAGLVEPRWQS
jgi:hypothetical protein